MTKISTIFGTECHNVETHNNNNMDMNNTLTENSSVNSKSKIVKLSNI